MKEDGISGFMCTEDGKKTQGRDAKRNLEEFLDYTEMHRRRSGWERRLHLLM